MRVDILKPFTCSRPEGARDLKAGDVFDIPDGLAATLEREGYVRRIVEVQKASSPEPAPSPTKPAEAADASDILDALAPAEEPVKAQERPAHSHRAKDRHFSRPG